MMNRDSKLSQRFWTEGKLTDCPIIDVHAHMHELLGGYINAPSPEEMLAMMDRAGTYVTLFCSHLALHCPEVGEQANLEPCQAYPSRFKAYHAVSSNHLHPQEDLERLEQYSQYYVGCKFLADYYGVPLEDPRHTPYWSYLNDHKLLALLHTWGGSRFDGVENVRKVAERYPDIPLICGHSFHSDWEQGIALGKEFPNVYFELTAVADDRGVIERLVEGVGSQRLLFGTDLPWFSTYHGIGAVLSADLSDDDRRNIFYRNAARLLRRFSWFQLDEEQLESHC